MSKKVVLLNTGHYSLDDRVFYHQAKSLLRNGFEVTIFSTKEDLVQSIDNIIISSYNDSALSHREKINKIIEHLNDLLPDTIICDTPLAVISSSIYKKKHKVKIIYDVTEWYPSKKNLRNLYGISRLKKIVFLFLFNILAGLKSDSFIFGEHYKSLVFRILFFLKPFLYLPYYPDLSYIEYYPPEKITNKINLLYSGVINTDKGIDSVIKSIEIAGLKKPDIQFNLKIIGYFPTNEDRNHFTKLCSNIGENIHIEIGKFLPFIEFCKVIGNTNLFFDLRKIDMENNHCLPIKLFYYLACGRPVIYSNLRSIRKDFHTINFGYLCDPNDYQSIAKHIIDYINNSELYEQQADNALEVSRSKYNWKVIENGFISFIEK